MKSYGLTELHSYQEWKGKTDGLVGWTATNVRLKRLEQFSNFLTSSHFKSGFVWHTGRSDWLHFHIDIAKQFEPVTNTIDFFKARKMGLVDVSQFHPHNEPMGDVDWQCQLTVEKDTCIGHFLIAAGDYCVKYTAPNNAGAYSGGIFAGSRDNYGRISD